MSTFDRRSGDESSTKAAAKTADDLKPRPAQESQGASAASGGGTASAPIPALPKGGGAIRGIGEKFSANPVTGTASLQIPIAASPGRAGFHPELALSYDSGAGNGPFGHGWQLSIPHIARKTDKGLPTYDDARDADLFIFSGAEDLVPSLMPDAVTKERFVDGDEVVQRYRPRVEGGFVRIEKREQRSTGVVYWQATTHDNTTSTYGRSENARIANTKHPRLVFSWLLEETRDDRGNVITYEYKAEDLVGVPHDVPWEANRHKGLAPIANRYLKRIRYGNTTMNEAPSEASPGLFELVFDYGEHDAVAATVDDTLPWPSRKDPFSTYRAGFEIRTYRLCRRVLMFHRIPELGATPCLVRSTNFSYAEGPVLTQLASATHAGYLRNADGLTYTSKTHPAVAFGYAPAVIQTRVEVVDKASLTDLPAGVHGPYQWVDLDGEGLPGVLSQQGGGLFYKQNLGGASLAPARLLMTKPSMTQLGARGRGFTRRATYDANRRATHLYVQPATGAEMLAERVVYGEAVASPEASNLRGKVSQRYDGAGVVTSVLFDFKGNLLQGERRLAKEYHAQVEWSALAALTDPAGIVAAAEALLEAEVFAGQTTYDALNRPTSLVTPDASEIRPGYNEASLLERVDVRVRGAVGWTTFVDDIDYDAKGQRERIVYGAGATETGYTYDALTFRLTRHKTTRASDGAVLQNLAYTYDPVGNITEIGDSAQQAVFFANDVALPKMAYVYDALYRLMQATGREQAGANADVQRDQDDVPVMNLPHQNDAQAVRPYAESYDYDAVGNILQMVHEGGAAVTSWTREYGVAAANNRLTGTSLPGDGAGELSATYGYDAHGNMTSMPHLASVAWNHRDEMAGADLGGGGTVYFTYDAAGQRVRKVWEHSGLVEERIYLGGYEVYRKRVASSGEVALERQTLHVMDGVRRVALVETKTVDADAGGAFQVATVTRYQMGNHLGSAVLEVDADGMVISYEEYHPYGTTAYQSGTSAAEVSRKRYRYTGKERDEETGLYYHGARYYAPWLGRWTAADPAGMVDGPGLYSYVHGNPINLQDPSGLEGVSLFAPVDQVTQALMGAGAPTLGHAKFGSAQQRLATPPPLNLKPTQQPLSSPRATTPPEPPTLAEKEEGVSDPELHALNIPVVPEPNASNVGGDPVRYISSGELKKGLGETPELDLSPERLRAVFATNDAQKAADYVASLPPSSVDKALGVGLELSPLGSVKDVVEGLQSGSVGQVALGVVGFVPIGKLAKLGKAVKILRLAKIAAKEEKVAEKLIRYSSLAEAEATAEARGLALRPGHAGPKRVAEAGADIEAKRLGKPSSYSHKIEMKVKNGTTAWLHNQRAWHIEGEPGRYAIPADKLDQFNDMILKMLITKVR